MTIRFIIPGQPVAKGRHRTTVRGGFARTYTPAKTVAYEGLVAMAGQGAMGVIPPLNGPVALEIDAVFAIPKSWPKWKRAKAIEGVLPHTGKPDADNLAKSCGDGLNGVCWGDDSQVCRLTVTKRYGATPGMSVRIEPAA